MKRTHEQYVEEWLRSSLEKIGFMLHGESLTEDQKKEAARDGQIVYSRPNRNAMAFCWRGRHISTLAWDFVTHWGEREYQWHDCPQFPMAEPEEIYQRESNE